MTTNNQDLVGTMSYEQYCREVNKSQNLGTAEEIVAVRRDESERTVEVKTNAGNVYGIDEAVRKAEVGQIKNVVVGHTAYGDSYLRGIGDGDKSNNLSKLPEF